jgi:hypothetical protein
MMSTDTKNLLKHRQVIALFIRITKTHPKFGAIKLAWVNWTFRVCSYSPITVCWLFLIVPLVPISAGFAELVG